LITGNRVYFENELKQDVSGVNVKVFNGYCGNENGWVQPSIL